MCFAVPVQIKEVLPDNQAKAVQKSKVLILNTQLLEGVKENDWVLTQANLATEKISAAEAKEILNYFKKTK